MKNSSQNQTNHAQEWSYAFANPAARLFLVWSITDCRNLFAVLSPISYLGCLSQRIQQQQVNSGQGGGTRNGTYQYTKILLPNWRYQSCCLHYIVDLGRADQLVGHHLYWQAKHNAATNMGSSIGARKKHMLEAEDSKDFEDECDDQRSRDVTSGKADCSAPVAKKRKKKAKGMGMSKDKGVSNIVSIHSRITDHLITF